MIWSFPGDRFPANAPGRSRILLTGPPSVNLGRGRRHQVAGRRIRQRQRHGARPHATPRPAGSGAPRRQVMLSGSAAKPPVHRRPASKRQCSRIGRGFRCCWSAALARPAIGVRRRRICEHAGERARIRSVEAQATPLTKRLACTASNTLRSAGACRQENSPHAPVAWRRVGHAAHRIGQQLFRQKPPIRPVVGQYAGHPSTIESVKPPGICTRG